MWLYMEVDDKAPRAVLASSGHVVAVTRPGREFKACDWARVTAQQ